MTIIIYRTGNAARDDDEYSYDAGRLTLHRTRRDVLRVFITRNRRETVPAKRKKILSRRGSGHGFPCLPGRKRRRRQRRPEITLQRTGASRYDLRYNSYHRRRHGRRTTAGGRGTPSTWDPSWTGSPWRHAGQTATACRPGREYFLHCFVYFRRFMNTATCTAGVIKSYAVTRASCRFFVFIP